MTTKNMNSKSNNKSVNSKSNNSKSATQSKSKTEKKVSDKVLNCETIKKALTLNDSVQFETAKTAKNTVNSASVLYQDFFALTLVSKENHASKRIIEYWGKKNNNCELLLTKQIFTQLSELKDSKDCAIFTQFFAVATLHKSKLLFRLSNDDAFLLIQAIVDNV